MGETTMLERRVGALDAVRGMAILAVVAVHSLGAMVAVTGSYVLPASIFQVFRYGEFGVQLFFALSGWLLFALYTGAGQFRAPVYWSRRIARIWPLWLVFLAISYLAYGVPNSGLPPWWGFVLGAVFLGWLSPALIAVPLGGLTIQQEVGHYALFAAFRQRGPAFFAGTVIAGYFSAWLARAVTVGNPETLLGTVAQAWLSLSLFQSWPFFLLGGAAFSLYRLWRTEGFAPILGTTPTTAVVVLVALGLGLSSFYSVDIPAYAVLGYVSALALLGLVLNAIPRVGGILQSIGRYSYFMYFMHFFVLLWLEDVYRALGLPDGDTTGAEWNTAVLLGILVSATAISWCLGWVSWKIFESPIMSWTRRRIPA